VNNYQVQYAPQWVSTHNLRGCEQLIDKFLRENAQNGDSSNVQETVNCSQEVKTTIMDNLPDYNDPMKTSFEQHRSQLQQELQQQQQREKQTHHQKEQQKQKHQEQELLYLEQSPQKDIHDDGMMDFQLRTNLPFVVKEEDAMASVHCSEMLCKTNDVMDGAVEILHNEEKNKHCEDLKEVDLRQQEGQQQQQQQQQLQQQQQQQQKHKGQETTTNNFVFNAWLECVPCARRFEFEMQWSAHMLHVHSEDRPYKCTVCSRGFRYKSHLVEHMDIHSDKMLYACDWCEKQFRCRSGRRNHMQRKVCRKLSEQK